MEFPLIFNYMKIVEITHALSSGGGERLIVDLSNKLSENPDNEVYMIITRPLSKSGNDHYLPFLSKKIKLIELNAPYGFSFKDYTSMYKTISKIKPDVVHSHGSFLNLIIPCIVFRNIKFFNTLHTLPSRLVKSRFLKIISKWLYKNHITPITISKECHKDFAACYGYSTDKLVVNGSEPLTCTPDAEIVRKEMDSYKSSADVPVFLHVARAHPVKNHVRLFNTFKVLEAEGHKFELVIVGSGYEVYDKDLIKSDHFHFVGEKRNVGDYMACADYFTLTSDKEGLPISLLEAMSMGVIPICTPAGGIIDVIQNHRNGFIPSIVSDDGYYNSVKEVLSGKFQISKDDIIKEFNIKYSMEKCASNYYNLFSDHYKETIC